MSTCIPITCISYGHGWCVITLITAEYSNSVRTGYVPVLRYIPLQARVKLYFGELARGLQTVDSCQLKALKARWLELVKLQSAEVFPTTVFAGRQSEDPYILLHSSMSIAGFVVAQ